MGVVGTTLHHPTVGTTGTVPGYRLHGGRLDADGITTPIRTLAGHYRMAVRREVGLQRGESPHLVARTLGIGLHT